MSLKLISEKLQAVASTGITPWSIMGQVPWNPTTNKAYFGINRLHLMSYEMAPAVMTRNQAEAQGLEAPDKLDDQVVCVRPTGNGFMSPFVVAPASSYGKEMDVREFHLGNAVEAVTKHVRVTGSLPTDTSGFIELLDAVAAQTNDAVAESEIPSQISHDAMVVILAAASGLKVERSWAEEWMDYLKPSKLVALASDVDERLRVYYRTSAPSEQSASY